MYLHSNLILVTLLGSDAYAFNFDFIGKLKNPFIASPVQSVKPSWKTL